MISDSKTANSTALDRLKTLYDEGSFTEFNSLAKAGESLTGVITAFGYVEGEPVYAFSQDVSVKSGALSKAQADKIKKLYDMAGKTGAPIVGIYDSFGADLSNGMDALTAYGELLLAVNNLSGVVPQISVVAGTCSGTSAMLATSADFVVMAKTAEMFVAPNSDAKNSADIASKSGTASLICDSDVKAVEMARKLVSKLPSNNLSPVPMFEFEESKKAFGKTASENAESICDANSVIELSDGFGESAYTALGSICGATVGICATNKTNAKLSADDCSKLARFVRTCDAFAIPVITLVDTEGFDTDSTTEKNGAVRDMAKIAHAYAEATTIKISVVTGKAYGAAFIALAGKGANADLTYATSNAVISPLAPTTAVEFFMHDKLVGAVDVSAKRAELAREYASTEATAQLAAENGAIDDVIAVEAVRSTLVSAIEVMAGKRVSRLPKKHSNMPF